MKNITKLYLKKYLTGSVLFFILSIVSGGINYLYYPTMARVLSLEEFGAVQSLIVILTQISSLFSGLSLLTIFLVKSADEKKISRIISAVQKAIVSILIFFTVVFIAFHSQVANFLNISDKVALFFVAIDLVACIPYVISFGYLLARKKYFLAAALQLSVASIKLLTGAMSAHEIGVVGAVAGIGLGYVIGMSIFWLVCKTKNIKTWEHSILASYRFPSKADFNLLRPYAVTIITILVTSACLIVYPSLDVIVARHYLNAETSSLYAAASTLSSAILFACMPIINILMPQIELGDFKKSLPKIRKTALQISGLGIFSLALLFFAATPLLSIFGRHYVVFSNILWLYGINMLLISFLNMLLQITVLYRPITGAVLSVLGVICAYFATMIFNSSANLIIATIASIYAIVAIICLFVVRLISKKTI